MGGEGLCLNGTGTSEIDTLSLHDALPIWGGAMCGCWGVWGLQGVGVEVCGSNGVGDHSVGVWYCGGDALYGGYGGYQT